MTPAVVVVLAQVDEPLVRWDWVARNTDLFWTLFQQHLFLTFVPMALGFALAFPMALVAVRWPRWYTPLLGVTGVLFTIPSLALFVLLLPFTGLGWPTPVIGLTIYTLLVLLRNNVEGFRSVPAEVREAAEAMGYTRRRLILRVELPLALPVILAGVRIAMVTTIGLVTITALIGWGGLGQLFIRGWTDFFPTPLVVGVVGSIAFAVVVDLFWVGVQRLVTPWAQAAR